MLLFPPIFATLVARTFACLLGHFEKVNPFTTHRLAYLRAESSMLVSSSISVKESFITTLNK